MSGKPVIALDVVRDDVQLAYDYFEERVGGSGERFLTRYFAITDTIAVNPNLFPLKFDDYRRALVPKSYFAIYYFRNPRAPSSSPSWTPAVIRA